MTRKNIVVMTGFSLILVIALLGCQSNGGNESVNANVGGEDENAENEENSQINEENTDQAEEEQEKDPDKDPVTLTLFNLGAGIYDDEVLAELVVDPVQEVYPHIDFTLINGSRDDLQDYIATGEVPDIIADSQQAVFELNEMGVVSDMRPFIEERGIDLSRFESVIFEVLDLFAEDGEIYGIPFGMNYGAMIYNRDVFDMFGVNYPTDGMTWSEVLELAREVTIEDGGVQYVGIEPITANALINPSEAYHVDPETGESAILKEPHDSKYIEGFEYLQQMYDFPGAADADGPNNGTLGSFLEGNVGMLTNWMSVFTGNQGDFEDIGFTNWDLVSWPSFDSMPGYGRQVDFHMYMVPPTGENIDSVYDVIEVLISDEVQAEMNRTSRITPINDLDMRSEHMASTGTYDGKNIEGIFTVDPSMGTPRSPYYLAVNAVLRDAAGQMAAEGIDVNTALRIADEEAQQAIEEVNAQRGE